MTSPKSKGPRVDDQAQPAVPQIPPPQIGQGHPDFFPMQTILEITKSLGEIKANIEHLTKNVDGIKTKVDDLVRWKTLILGGVFVIGLFISGAVFVMSKFSIDISPRSPTEIPTSIPQPKPDPQQKQK